MVEEMDNAQEVEEPTGPMDLNGEFRFKVDAKGRLQLPSKFRKSIAKDLVVSVNPQDECLYVFDNAGFNGWVERLFASKFGGFDETNLAHIGLHRALKRRARDVEVDGSGRIMLSADQRDAVGIDKEVVLVGERGHFEIWDAKRYDEAMESIDLSVLFS